MGVLFGAGVVQGGWHEAGVIEKKTTRNMGFSPSVC